MTVRFHRIGRRFAIVLGGEGLQSAFGFGLNVALARTLPAKSYGEFALVMLIGGFALIYMRALIGIPACTFIPQCRSTRAAGALAVTFASGALALSAAGGLMVSATLTLYRCDFAWAAGLFIGLWAMRGYHRIALFAQSRAALSTVSDFGFTVSATAFCVPLLLWHGATDGLSRIFLALAAAHLIGIAMALALQGGPLPDFGPAQRPAAAPQAPAHDELVARQRHHRQRSGARTDFRHRGDRRTGRLRADRGYDGVLLAAEARRLGSGQHEPTGPCGRDQALRRPPPAHGDPDRDHRRNLPGLWCLHGRGVPAPDPTSAGGPFRDRAAERDRVRDLGHRQHFGALFGPEDVSRNHARFPSDQHGFGTRCGRSAFRWSRSIVWTTTPAWSLIGTTLSELIVFLGCWFFASKTLRALLPGTPVRIPSAVAAIGPVPQNPVLTGALTYAAPFVDPA